MTNNDLAAVLEYMASKATPGPWKIGSPSFQCTMNHRHGHGECRYTLQGWHEGEYWSKYIHRDKPMELDADAEMVAGTWDYECGGIKNTADAQLITALINSLPQILSALRK